VKAQILTKLGREEEAKPIMQSALHSPTATPSDIHQYGRLLLGEKKIDEAMQVFQYNAERNGDAWPVHVGLARGYAAQGDTQKALEHAKKALPQAPDDLNRKSLEAMIEALTKGASIN
jgi:Tfp pilus assembly protein PilF